MIIRRLANCNEADWQQELMHIGLEQSVAATIAFKPENTYLKIIGYGANDFAAILESKQGVIRPRVFTGHGKNSSAIIECPPGWLEAVCSANPDELPEQFVEKLIEFRKNISREQWLFRSSAGEMVVEEPMLMGILNVTPDSFSDGGHHFSKDEALKRAEEMIKEGAVIIDVGGESTRPGAPPVSAEEEWERIGTVISGLSRLNCWISVDTYKSEIARKAIEAGAHIINDISAMTADPRMIEVVSRYNVPVVMMHMRGTPQTMQKKPRYEHLMEEIFLFLQEGIRRARQAGIQNIIIDPGIGFGKRLEDNFEILRRIAELKALGCPILLGASRKSFIGNSLEVPVSERLSGTLATSIIGLLQGVKILRVHDVHENSQAMKILRYSQTFKA